MVGNKVVKDLNKNMDADGLADIVDDMEDNRIEAEQIAEIFVNAATEDEDDLMEELNRIEAEALGPQLGGKEIDELKPLPFQLDEELPAPAEA